MFEFAIRSLFVLPWILGQTSVLRDGYSVSFVASADALLHGRLEQAEEGLRTCLELQPENANCAYYLACVRARAGDPDGALEWLERAVAWGFVDAALADWDADLESLRESARYSALRARMVPRLEEAAHRAEILDWPGLFTHPAGSADGTRLLDGIYLWDVASGELVRTLTREPKFNELSWLSPDGRFAVVLQDTETLGIWDGTSGEFLREIHTDRARPLGFSADGSTVLAGRSVWSLESGELRAELEGSEAGSAGWLNRDGTLALTRGEASAGLYSTSSGELLARFAALPPLPGQRSGGFSVDGERAFLLEGETGTLLVIDVESRALLRSIGGGTDKLWGFVCLADGDTLVTSDEAGKLRWWDLERGEPILERQALSEGSLLKLSSDGRFLFEGFFADICVWDAQTATKLWEDHLVDEMYDPASHSEFLGDTDVLCIPGWQNRVELRDAGTGVRTKTIGRQQLEVAIGAMDASGRKVAIPASDGTVRVVDVASGNTLRVLTGLEGRVLRAVWSSDGNLLAAMDEHGTVRTWDEAGAARARFEVPSVPMYIGGWSCGDLSFSPDAERLLAWGLPHWELEDQQAWCGLWNPKTGAVLTRIPVAEGQRFEQCAWSPDGSKLATAGSDGELRLWDGVSGAEIKIELAHPKAVTAVAFHPDGRRLATGCADTRARLWDLETRKIEREFAHKYEVFFDEPQVVSGLAFDAGGARLVTTVTDWGEIACWDVESGRRLWLQGSMDGQEGFRIPAFFDATGARIAYMPLFEALVVATETGHELSDLSGIGGWPLQPFGPEYLTLSGDGLTVLDATSLQVLYTRLEFPDGERLVHVPTLYCDGPAAALRSTRLFLDGKDYPLDAFAGVLLDPKRVRAAIEGVQLTRPRLVAPPEAEREPAKQR